MSGLTASPKTEGNASFAIATLVLARETSVRAFEMIKQSSSELAARSISNRAS